MGAGLSRGKGHRKDGWPPYPKSGWERPIKGRSGWGEGLQKVGRLAPLPNWCGEGQSGTELAGGRGCEWWAGQPCP